MFDLFTVKPDYRNLKGILFVMGNIRVAPAEQYSKLPGGAFLHRSTFISVHTRLTSETYAQLEDVFKGPISNNSLPEMLEACEGYFDGYDLGLMKDERDWNNRIREAKEGYTLEHEIQKYDLKVNIEDIGRPEARRHILGGILANLVLASKMHNRFAQTRAQGVLKQFLSNPKYGGVVDDFITIAPAVGIIGTEVLENRIQLALSLACEDFHSIRLVQEEYAQLTRP
jgi:hypothetical protein